eukprot:SAG11_NODE_1741_length_4336_cov_1.517583_7_plen_54_part_00
MPTRKKGRPWHLKVLDRSAVEEHVHLAPPRLAVQVHDRINLQAGVKMVRAELY